MFRTTLAFFCLILLAVTMVSCTSQQEETVAEVESLLSKGKYIPDIGTFLQIGRNTPAGYSWDGKDVYFTSGMSGASQVYRLTEERWPYQLTTFEDGIDFFRLSHNGQMAIVGASVGGSEQSQLYLMNPETGRVIQLTHFDDIQMGSVVWAKDNKSVFYRSNEANGRDFFLYRMDVSTGDSKMIFGEVPGYNTIGEISQDGNLMVILNLTSNVNDDLYLLDLSTGKHEKLTEDEGEFLYDNVTIMPDNKTLYLTCNGNDDGMQRMATMTVGSPEVNYIDDGWIDARWETDALIISRDYKYMAALVNEDGYVRLTIREVASKKELPSLPLDGIISGGYFGRNGSCLISYSGPTHAPDVWRWNPNTRDLEQLTHSIYAGIDRNVFTEPKLVHFKSFDDLEIPAFLYLPPDYKEGEQIPFIVHAHGGPEGQFQPHFYRNFQYLMLNGYGVLAVNPRGSSGYGREYLNLDNYKNRKNSLKDYKAAADWLMANGYTKKGMMGIRGGSYGGYVVLGMITEYPDLFSAAIDVVGIANFKTFLENTRAYRRALRESEYGPLSDPEFLKSISPVHKAHLIKTPLLVIHGENDPRVPIGEARQIIKAVQNNGGVVDSLIFSNEGHGSGKRVNTIAEYRKQVEFLDRNLKVLQLKKDTN